MDFKVDIEGLGAIEKNLSRSSENLEQALNAMKDASPESLGYPSLDEACAEFREVWQTGLEKVRECGKKLTEGLGQAKKDYAELDNSVSEQFTKMRGDIEGMSGT